MSDLNCLFRHTFSKEPEHYVEFMSSSIAIERVLSIFVQQCFSSIDSSKPI